MIQSVGYSTVNDIQHQSGNENFYKFSLIYWKENHIFQWLTFFDDSNDDAWIGWGDRKQEDKRIENL